MQKLWKRCLSVTLAIAVTVGTFAGDFTQVQAKDNTIGTSTPTIEELRNTAVGDYVSTIATPQDNPVINPDYDRSYDDYEVESDAGFLHPGILMNREELNIMRDMVWIGAEPWASTFEELQKSSYVQDSYTPSGPYAVIASDKESYALARGATAAYELTLMWYITGQQKYADKAISIIRGWTDIFEADTQEDHIRRGMALHKLCISAEILRYTPSSGWNEEDTASLCAFLDAEINAVDKAFQYYNQGIYATMAYMAKSIFEDNATNYADSVERLAYNKNFGWKNGNSVNFSLTSMLFNSGEIVEMGRDQEHAWDDLAGLEMLVKTTYVQETKVDEKGNIVSVGGEDLYEFDNQKLLKAAAYWQQYAIGYELPYVANSNAAGQQTEWATLSRQYRGRQVMWLPSLYYHYRYTKGYEDEEARTIVTPTAEDTDQTIDPYATYGDIYQYITLGQDLSVQTFLRGTNVDFPDYEDLTFTPLAAIVSVTAEAPQESAGAVDNCESYNRYLANEFTGSGDGAKDTTAVVDKRNGGAITEPAVDEEGNAHFVSTDIQSGEWLAYSIDLDETFGSNLDTLIYTYGSNVTADQYMDVYVGDYLEAPQQADYEAAVAAGKIGTIAIGQTGGYTTYKSYSGKMDDTSKLNGKKTIYFYCYGSNNVYGFHGQGLWLKFVDSRSTATNLAADADLTSSNVTDASDGKTLSNGDYLGYSNMDFDNGFSGVTFDINTASAGTLKLYTDAADDESGTLIASYDIAATDGTVTFEQTKQNAIIGRHAVYFVYEGEGTLTMRNVTFGAKVTTDLFNDEKAGNYTYIVNGTATKTAEEGLLMQADTNSKASYIDVSFGNGATTLAVTVKSTGSDNVLHFDAMGAETGDAALSTAETKLAEFALPDTTAMSEDGYVTFYYTLTTTRNDLISDVFVTMSATGSGTVDVKTFRLNPENTAPELTVRVDDETAPLGTDTYLELSTSYDYQVAASDADGDEVQVAVYGTLPVGYTYENGILHVPASVTLGTKTVQFLVTDGVVNQIYTYQFHLASQADSVQKIIDDSGIEEHLLTYYLYDRDRYDEYMAVKTAALGAPTDSAKVQALTDLIAEWSVNYVQFTKVKFEYRFNGSGTGNVSLYLDDQADTKTTRPMEDSQLIAKTADLSYADKNVKETDWIAFADAEGNAISVSGTHQLLVNLSDATLRLISFTLSNEDGSYTKTIDAAGLSQLGDSSHMCISKLDNDTYGGSLNHEVRGAASWMLYSYPDCSDVSEQLDFSSSDNLKIWPMRDGLGSGFEFVSYHVPMYTKVKFEYRFVGSASAYFGLYLDDQRDTSTTRTMDEEKLIAQTAELSYTDKNVAETDWISFADFNLDQLSSSTEHQFLVYMSSSAVRLISFTLSNEDGTATRTIDAASASQVQDYSHLCINKLDNATYGGSHDHEVRGAVGWLLYTYENDSDVSSQLDFSAANSKVWPNRGSLGEGFELKISPELVTALETVADENIAAQKNKYETTSYSAFEAAYQAAEEALENYVELELTVDKMKTLAAALTDAVDALETNDSLTVITEDPSANVTYDATGNSDTSNSNKSLNPTFTADAGSEFSFLLQLDSKLTNPVVTVKDFGYRGSRGSSESELTQIAPKLPASDVQVIANDNGTYSIKYKNVNPGNYRLTLQITSGETTIERTVEFIARNQTLRSDLAAKYVRMRVAGFRNDEEKTVSLYLLKSGETAADTNKVATLSTWEDLDAKYVLSDWVALTLPADYDPTAEYTLQAVVNQRNIAIDFFEFATESYHNLYADTFQSYPLSTAGVMRIEAEHYDTNTMTGFDAVDFNGRYGWENGTPGDGTGNIGTTSSVKTLTATYKKVQLAQAADAATTAISLNADRAYMYAGETQSTTVTVTPQENTLPVSYSSSNPATATISADGTITAVAPGTTQLYALNADLTSEAVTICVADKTYLQNVMTTYTTYIAENLTVYKQSSAEALQSAYAQAQTALSAESAETVYAATVALQNAINQKVMLSNVEVLKYYLAVAGDLVAVKSGYTQSTWTQLETAISAAQGYTAESAQNEINEGIKTLRSALDALTTDKQLLNALITRAGEIDQTKYTQTYWAAFAFALTGAQETAAKTDATAREVVGAATTLENAIDALRPILDRTVLESTYAQYQGISGTGYTTASYQAFATAFAALEAVRSTGDDDQTQQDIDDACTAVTTAADALQQLGDKTELTELYNECEAMTQDNYTDESWAAFTQAVTAAKAVLDNSEALQTEIDLARETLADAKEYLTEKPAPVDKSGLQALYDTCTGLEEDKYTTASWAEVTAKLTAAKQVLDSEEATQEEVTAAYNALSAAYRALVVETLATTLTFDQSSYTLYATATLAMKVTLSNTEDKITGYSSSAATIVTVTANGVLTGVKAGTATITVTTASGAKASVKVTVKKPSVKLTYTKGTLKLKKSTTALKVSDKLGTDKVVSWKSSNKKIVTVTSSGKLTAKKTGTATITVTMKSGATAKCKVTVKKTVKNSVKFKKTSYKLKVKATLQTSCALANTFDSVKSYTSSNKKVVTVSKTGVLTGKKKGTATITVKTKNGATAKVKVTVKK